jgi:3-methyladenine DNA glycosylase AlkD
MHKAVGWMLREAGKRNQGQLVLFLDQHRDQMPRTMIRYAIEKFPENMRKSYLIRGKIK